MVLVSGFWFFARAGVARAFRTLGFPRVRRGAVLIDASGSNETRGKYRSRDHGADFPRDFYIAFGVEAFHGLEKAGDA
jgi:hypothetical protein